MPACRVANPEALRHPALAYWLAGVCEHFHLPVHAPAHIAEVCARADVQVLLGVEGDEPRALLVTELPTPFNVRPFIVLGYNRGTRALGRELLLWATRWVREQGYTSFDMINRSGSSDAVYERKLRGLGRVTDKASVLTVELEG
jgi:hypothetical protein